MANNDNAFPYAQRIALVDENGKSSIYLGDTAYGGSPVIIDIGHHEIHCGDHYTATSTADVGNGANDDIMIIVGNHETKRYHLVTDIISEAEAHFYLYEGASLSASGTAIASYNRDRNSANTSDLKLYHNSSATIANSTIIHQKHWGSGKGVGGDERGAHEFILKNNTKYLFRTNNATTSNNQISWKLDYYIHPDS